jgi:hypothetical protein
VRAVHDVAGVVTVNVPFTDLRKSTDDRQHLRRHLACGNVAYPSLTDANTTVTVTDL